MSLTRRIPKLIIMTAVLGACGGTDEPRDTQQAGDLSAEQIARLAEQYPRLGPEPLPQPQPSDAAEPDQPPRRIAANLPDEVLETVTGGATFYANKFEGRRTASGIPFRQNQMVAAHRGYPFGTILRVTNLRNDRSVNVRVVDRGPFGASAARGTIIDLSRRAAENLGFISAGRAQVRVEVLEWGRGITTA
ncbi:MAG TPA: septal ring lytic transglycosylase RlpA family protein [Longimicrobiales bacterium]|nr:septal ring lytic transglycosylase RlpA family protein [Longimicrobiales bacterium]